MLSAKAIDRKAKLGKLLIEIGAIKYGQFTLSSGQTSDVYVDIKLAALHPQTLQPIGQCFYDLLEDISYDSIGCDEGPGPSTLLGVMLNQWAIVGSRLYSYKAAPTGYIVRKEAKDHGTCQPIEGIIGIDPIFIEDVATTGKNAIAAIKKMNVKPKNILCVVDRQSGAKEKLETLGIALHSIFTLQELREMTKNEYTTGTERISSSHIGTETG